MTIFEHPQWPLLRKYLYIAQKGRGGVNGPRHRIEIRKQCPPSVFAIAISCAHCGATINPVRQTKRKVWTFNVSCPLRVELGCARTKEAHEMARRVRAAMEEDEPPPPAPPAPDSGRLFT